VRGGKGACIAYPFFLNSNACETADRLPASAFKVHNTLGAGFLEKVYENALLHELVKEGIACEQQRVLKVLYLKTANYRAHRGIFEYKNLLNPLFLCVLIPTCIHDDTYS
jgi:hypothetical protein